MFHATISLTNRCLHFRIPNLPGSHTTITIGSQTIECDAAHLEVIEELGRGAYGVVEKMRHTPSGTIMAVKVNCWLVHAFQLKMRSGSADRQTNQGGRCDLTRRL